MKEEIFLAKYAGVNTFTFLLNTDGLGMYQENGRWYLAETQNAQSRVELGDVVTFDANGRFSAVFSSATTLNQSVTWSSSNPTAVSVNATTGAITANTPGGEAIITVQKIYNGTTYSRYYRVYVSGAQEGSYYIRNKGLDSYMQLDDNAFNDFTVNGIIMELWPYNGADYQKWVLTDLGSGYYKITSAQSGKALSVLSDYVNTDGMSLVQEVYIGADRQRWKLDRTESGSYVLRPKSAEGYDTDWCMCAGTESGTDGYNVEQRAYSLDADYLDEWRLAFTADFMTCRVSSTSFSVQCIGATTLSNEWYPLIVSAVDSWNDSRAETSITLTTETSPYTCAVEENSASWLGNTTSYFVGSVTYAATIIINTSTISDSDNARKSTIAHELGHVLGLDDNPNVSTANDSLMSHYRDREVVFIPQPHDEKNVLFMFANDE